MSGLDLTAILLKPEFRGMLVDGFEMTIIMRPKKPPAASNDNEPCELWNDELKELYDRYDK